MQKLPRILYFVNGVSPTDSQFEEAHSLKADVVFRNATVVPQDGALENCDGVAGDVPERYAEAFPDAESAIADFGQRMKKAKDESGDIEPPQKPVKRVQQNVKPEWGTPKKS